MVNEVLDKIKIAVGKKNIHDLVVKFTNGYENYMSRDSKEEDIKIEFINPFFKALGWDVYNEKGKDTQFKEVIFEESIKVGRKTKNPDYTFQIGGTKIFYVEAKAPYIDLNHDKHPAFQVRRYGWSTDGVDLSILTDFEELAIYETTTRPDKYQNPSIGRVKYYKFADYEDNWEDIYSILSKEAVEKGLTKKFIKGTEGVKKGTSTLDKEFLKEISTWRNDLARNIANRNHEISEEALNYSVQLLIDRILFLRMAEDRGIEKYKTLYNLTQKKDIYEKLVELFHIADKKYNSGLFCLSADPTRHMNRDTVTEKLIIDDNVFKKIISSLYYPDSPYEFSVISPDILGVVYEKFLGSTISLTDKHRARIEEKTIVRKQGGVFYTPQNIVNDIVENTLGKLVKNKSIKELDKLKIIDIACGSGSFLLATYKFLLKTYLEKYSSMKRPPRNTIYTGRDGVVRLTISEKKRILKNSIYGVDVDFLAVEVSKLTLLLQVLEDQNKDVVEQQQKLYHERVLPDLSDNIKNGNSVIGTDYITSDRSYEEIKTIKPFNYQEEFPTVFNDGGFDVIVTNPPYVRGEKLDKNEKAYYKKHYSVYHGQADLYTYFYEKAFQLLKDNGYFGLICSNKFTRAKYGKKLRKFLSQYNLIKYNDYTGDKIFKDATVDSSVLIFHKKHDKNNKIHVNDEFDLEQSLLNDNSWGFYPPHILELRDKIVSKGVLIKDLDLEINAGIKTGFNKAFIIDNELRKELINKDPSCKEIIKPLLRGRDVKEDKIHFDNKYLILTKSGVNINDYPSIKEHLSQYRKELKNRSDTCDNWYNLRSCSFYDKFDENKLIYPNMAPHLFTFYDTEGYYTNQKCFIITSDTVNLKYVHALLSSSVLNFVFVLLGSPLGDKGYDINKYFVEQLSIVFNTDLEDTVVNLTDKILLINDKINNNNYVSPSERVMLTQQLKSIKNELKSLIYQIYDLNNDEIKIIESLYSPS